MRRGAVSLEAASALATLAAVACWWCRWPHLAGVDVAGLVITFTGNVTKDFPVGPGVFIATDFTGDTPFPHADGSMSPSGWDVTDIRYSYDVESDTAYFGRHGEGEVVLVLLAALVCTC